MNVCSRVALPGLSRFTVRDARLCDEFGAFLRGFGGGTDRVDHEGVRRKALSPRGGLRLRPDIGG